MKPRLNVHLVSAFRKIATDGTDKLSGAGLVKELRKLQSPEYKEYDASKARFERICEFLRTVLDEPKARLEIPAENDDIYVVIDNKTLPLTSLGTGIHEVVILSAAVTLVDNAIFCIEEPEIHCHPQLQKKFARYLLGSTTNQYFIASHSNAFLDLPDANMYRCWLDQSGCTQCELASTASEKHTALSDLGYKLSDLLQANYVIWVEGPSDRIYLNHWIREKAPGLVEGLHYSVMFYGGRLLSHLCYGSEAPREDDEVGDFVRLARLNRNACIVIDSDRKNGNAELNATKQRVIAEFRKNSCLVWVTGGRTIENYVPEVLLNEAIAHVHPQKGEPIKQGRFRDVTRLGKKIVDKVAVARHVAGKDADFSMLDLGEAVDNLVNRIRDHNT